MDLVYIYFGILITILICSVGGIIYLLRALHKKQQLDLTEKNKYEQDLAFLQQRKNTLDDEIKVGEDRVKKTHDEFQQLMARRTDEINEFYETNKQRRMAQLDADISQQEAAAKQLLDVRLKKYEDDCNDAIRTCVEQIEGIQAEAALKQEQFNSLTEPMRLYEMEQQQKLFYTVQIPVDYRDDISYLLTTVAQQVRHKDIISKLVWAEYIKPAMDDTCRRVGIEDKSGIYKITNIDSGKCYIGKSTNVKKRIQDHFKSSVGITSIADQAVHHAMLEEGLWNWAVEVVIYCDKEKLNEMEKYYIEFFKANEFGYNKNSGGGG